MGQADLSIGQGVETGKNNKVQKSSLGDDFVLEKNIFNNVFDKDIRRVYLYKKAERIAKALYLIAPAFAKSPSLRNRLDAVALALVDAATLPLAEIRMVLSRELLTLSTILSIAKTSGLLSEMNTELITQEVHFMLQETASYEEPRIFLEELPSLSGMEKSLQKQEMTARTEQGSSRTLRAAEAPTHQQGQKEDDEGNKRHIRDRDEAILSVIKNKGRANIKDISHVVRNISEKTIQRELLRLVLAGVVVKEGERRWSTYALK